jgi:hypothetical protein
MILTFKKHDDPLHSLGIGQRKLIEDWLDNIYIKNYTIHDDLSIDINESVDVSIMKNIPDFIKINNYNELYFHSVQPFPVYDYPRNKHEYIIKIIHS